MLIAEEFWKCVRRNVSTTTEVRKRNMSKLYDTQRSQKLSKTLGFVMCRVI